jgi:hypothetical protein
MKYAVPLNQRIIRFCAKEELPINVKSSAKLCYRYCKRKGIIKCKEYGLVVMDLNDGSSHEVLRQAGFRISIPGTELK